MATTKELSVEEKLRALYDLQIIDTRIDEIRNVRGELPLEVEDLEEGIVTMEFQFLNIFARVFRCDESTRVMKCQVMEAGG